MMAQPATPRVSREEQKRRTRAALIVAARGLFIEQGYTVTTAEAIARAAGVSRATFYLHFHSKSEIVVELMRSLESEIVGAYEELGRVRRPTRKRLRKWLSSHAELWRARRMEFTAMEQALANEPQVREEWLELYTKLVAAVLDGRRVPQGPEREQHHSSLMAIVMSIDRSFYFTVLHETEGYFEPVLDGLTELLAVALTGGAAEDEPGPMSRGTDRLGSDEGAGHVLPR